MASDYNPDLTVTLPYFTTEAAVRALLQQADRLDDLVKAAGDISYSESVTLPLRRAADEARSHAQKILRASLQARGIEP